MISEMAAGKRGSPAEPGSPLDIAKIHGLCERAALKQELEMEHSHILTKTNVRGCHAPATWCSSTAHTAMSEASEARAIAARGAGCVRSTVWTRADDFLAQMEWGQSATTCTLGDNGTTPSDRVRPKKWMTKETTFIWTEQWQHTVHATPGTIEIIIKDKSI